MTRGLATGKRGGGAVLQQKRGRADDTEHGRRGKKKEEEEFRQKKLCNQRTRRPLSDMRGCANSCFQSTQNLKLA